MAGRLKIFFKKSKAPSSIAGPAKPGPKSEAMHRFDWAKDGWVDRLITTRYPELRTKSDLLAKLVAEDMRRAGEEEREELKE